MGKLSAGDWVEVRSKEEILRTLDEKGQLDGMPFMPEMFAFCGEKMQVYKRAHKTCDTVFPIRGRRVQNAVHLETRCNGSSHGGCQAGCLLFWKEEWLKPVSRATDLVTLEKPVATQNANQKLVNICTESAVQIHTQDLGQQGADPVYVCQATRLPYMTSDLSWWELDQYIEDYTSGNIGLWRMFCGMVYSAYYHLSNAGIGLGRPMRWFYNTFHRLWGATLFPRNSGTIPIGQSTPTEVLNLQPGELVRVKSHEEILRTLTTDGKNRGMTWDAELVPYCGEPIKYSDV